MATAQVVETSVTVNSNSPIHGLGSPGRSYPTYLWNNSWVQTCHETTSDRLWTDNTVTFCLLRTILLGQLIFVSERTMRVLTITVSLWFGFLKLFARFTMCETKGNEWFSSNVRLSYAHRIMGSPGGKHCKSLQRNVWLGAVSPLKAVSLDRECRILPWFYEKRRCLMLVFWNCKFLWDQWYDIYR